MATKSEKVAELEEYKGNLEREMDELTVTLFEEAHEMVRVEKEARHKDHMLLLLQETQDKSSVLQEELKASRYEEKICGVSEWPLSVEIH